MHSLLAGVDNLVKTVQDLPVEVPVTNACGAFSPSLAEYVMSVILHFNKNFPRLIENRQNREWDKFTMDTVSGKTVGFLGFGSIGQTTARLCKAFGMRVIADSRTRTDPSGLANTIYDESGLDRVLTGSDYRVCCLPLTGATRHFMNLDKFAKMLKSSIFISIGRGECVDEAALIHALETGMIAGAGLDVFEVEPLPAESKLWGFHNVVITSHNADYTESYFRDSLAIFYQNLERFRDGEELMNPVNRQLRY